MESWPSDGPTVRSDVHARGKRAGPQDQGEVARFFHGRVRAHVDLATRADAVTDDGRTHDLAVQHDGEVVPDVRAAEALELSTSGTRELELHL